MKRNILFCTVILCAFFTVFSVQAQDQPPVATLTFMDAEAGYVDLETKIWKPMHAKRVANGKIYGWYLYRVANPYDAKRGYNYMTAEVYPNWNALEGAYSDLGAIAAEVHPGTPMSEITRRTEEARSIVRSTVWTRRDGVVKDGVTNADVKYVVVDWMDVHPGHMGEYMDMEREVFKPVHQTRVDDGHILGWSLFTRVGGYSDLPGGMDAATGASYASWADIWDSYPDDAWERAHPGVDPAEMFAEILKHRNMLGSTIFELVDYVEAQE
ncbi:MAG: hypothetical protein R3301_10620 [Saprospiraceae bacterium]|nr:hypothetical protein [Saprospiraceae bacterium]